MVRAVEQIEREIAALDQTVAAIAQAFHDAYQHYLTALGQATRQQLILAGYHICTHGYPEQFLDLSLNQRQELQQALQQLGKQGQTELLECLNPVTAVEPDENNSLRVNSNVELALNIGKELDEEIFELEEFQPQPENVSADFAASPTMAAATEDASGPSLEGMEAEGMEANIEQSSEALEIALTSDGVVPDQADDHSGEASSFNEDERPLYPSDIAHWQTRLEDEITEVLQNLSHSANRALQKANVLPNRLPEPVLEVAAKADLSSETVSPPNLLNLLIESDEEGKSSMTQIIAIRLRLSEIEFGAAAAAAHRSKLRLLMAQLTKLGREYQRKQKECAIARAEAAWRSSWFEAEG